MNILETKIPEELKATYARKAMTYLIGIIGPENMGRLSQSPDTVKQVGTNISKALYLLDNESNMVEECKNYLQTLTWALHDGLKQRGLVKEEMND
jgi:hypothetical protein